MALNHMYMYFHIYIYVYVFEYVFCVCVCVQICVYTFIYIGRQCICTATVISVPGHSAVPAGVLREVWPGQVQRGRDVEMKHLPLAPSIFGLESLAALP